MRVFKCELCDSTELVKQDGMFVCQSCGTKYSVEEARKLMVEVSEGLFKTKGNNIDESVKSFFVLAQNAYQSENLQETEVYCNKIIELDPTNVNAWMLKGKAAGWQSTLQNPRLLEAVSAFSVAINNSSDKEKQDLIQDAQNEIVRIAVALINLRGQQFEKWPDEEEAEGFYIDIERINIAVEKLSGLVNLKRLKSELHSEIASRINQIVVQTWTNKIELDYRVDLNNSDEKPEKPEWNLFVNRIDYCLVLLKKAIELCDDDNEDNIVRYENMVFFQKQAIDSAAWDYEYNEFGKEWYEAWTLSKRAKESRLISIKEYEDQIQRIKTINNIK